MSEHKVSQKCLNDLECVAFCCGGSRSYQPSLRLFPKCFTQQLDVCNKRLTASKMRDSNYGTMACVWQPHSGTSFKHSFVGQGAPCLMCWFSETMHSNHILTCLNIIVSWTTNATVILCVQLFDREAAVLRRTRYSNQTASFQPFSHSVFHRRMHKHMCLCVYAIMP